MGGFSWEVFHYELNTSSLNTSWFFFLPVFSFREELVFLISGRAHLLSGRAHLLMIVVRGSRFDIIDGSKCRREIYQTGSLKDWAL